MQLSSANLSVDSSLASLLLPSPPIAGVDAALAPVSTAPAGTGLTGFAKLFPELAANGKTPAEVLAPPTRDVPAVFSLAAPATNVAEILPLAFASAAARTGQLVAPASTSAANSIEVEVPASEFEGSTDPLVAPSVSTGTSLGAGAASHRKVGSVAQRAGSTRAPVAAKSNLPEDLAALNFVAGPQFSESKPLIEFSADVPPEAELEASELPVEDFLSAKSAVAFAGRESKSGRLLAGETLTAGGGPKAMETTLTSEHAPMFTPRSDSKAISAAMDTPENSLTRQAPSVNRADRSTPAPNAEAKPLPVPTAAPAADPTPINPAGLVELGAEAPAQPITPDAPDIASRQSTDLRQFAVENPGAEKFADVALNSGAVKNDAEGESDKKVLNPLAKRVATRGSALGTAVARSEAVMSTATFSNRPLSSVALDRAPVAAPPALETAPATRADAPISAEAPATAHRAVEAVLTAVERFSSGDRHAVNMQFSVGGADLTVRVELRADQVHATFRTDSPELRAALATEWSAVTPQGGDRGLRLAPPVFGASSDGNFGGFSGDTSSRDRDAQTPRTVEEMSAVLAARSRAVSKRSPAPTEFLPRAAAALSSATALHLSTLA